MVMECAELEALKEGIHWARDKNVARIVLDSDCAAIVNHFNTYHEDISILGHQVNVIKSLSDSFLEVQIRWISRNCNKATDKLSRMALEKHCTLSFNMDYPREIHDIVITDSF